MHDNIPMFQALYANGLIDMDGVNEQVIQKIPFSKLLDIYDEVSASVAYLPNNQKLLGRVHCASNSFAGGRNECAAMKCRLRRVEELSKFSTLFGENVLCHNFLADSSPTYGHAPKKDTNEFRKRALADINVLFGLKATISLGIVTPYTLPHGICINCFSKKFLGNSSTEVLGNGLKSLEKEILNNMDISILKRDDRYLLRYSADETILPHNLLSRLSQKDYESLPADISQSLKNSDSVSLNYSQMKKLPYSGRISKRFMIEAVQQKSMAKLTGGTIVTHSLSEINALKKLESNDQISHVNSVLSEHWNIIIPYAEQLSIDNLIQLREREQESFVQFRSTIEQSVAEAMALKKDFTARDARELFSDTIAPNLARIEQSTKLATFDLVKKPLTAAAGIGAVLGVGAYTGMLTGDLASATKALGLGKIIYDGVTSSLDALDSSKERKQNDYYFLWKMSHMAAKT